MTVPQLFVPWPFHVYVWLFALLRAPLQHTGHDQLEPPIERRFSY